MKKNIVSIACACGIAFALVGCSGQDAQGGNSPSDQQEGQAAAEQRASEKPSWWPEVELAEKIPYPASLEGEVKSESATSIQIEVKNSSLADARKYIDACIDAGYTVDTEDDGVNYEAFSSDGYELRVYPHKNESFFVINLDAPRKLSALSWPTSGPASLLPAPPSTLAEIDVDSTTAINYLVGDMDAGAFDEYAAACKDAGFSSVEIERTGWYSAKDSTGNKLVLEYMGYDVVRISLTLAA